MLVQHAIRRGIIGRRRPAYLPETQALLARMTVQPTAARAKLYDDLIKALIASGAWSKRDGYHVLAAHDAQAARLNLKGTPYTANALNSPAFTPDRGFAGDGSTSYVDSGFNPATAGGQYTLNSANFAIWSRNVAGTSGSIAGWFVSPNGTTIQPHGSNDVAIGRINTSGSLSTSNGVVPDGSGLFSVTRPTATSMRLSRNGVVIASASTTATAVANGALCYGRVTTAGFSTAQIAFGAFGGQLTTAEEQAEYAAINAWMVAVGAA